MKSVYKYSFSLVHTLKKNMCILCGSSALTSEKHYILHSRLLHALDTSIEPTKLHYTMLRELPPQERHLICRHCSNWLRYLRHKSVKKQYTPLDTVLMFALEPGSVPEPDRRSLYRLLATATDPNNRFAGAIPYPARKIMQQAVSVNKQHVAAALVRAWWEYNGYTVFFRNKSTSRIVRRVVRNSRET